jgi:hypothetical protein
VFKEQINNEWVYTHSIIPPDVASQQMRSMSKSPSNDAVSEGGSDQESVSEQGSVSPREAKTFVSATAGKF